MSELTLVDLVRNGTMNVETAATLAAIAAEQHSFMVVAVPRFAGKSTVTNAMLHYVPANVPRATACGTLGINFRATRPG